MDCMRIPTSVLALVGGDVHSTGACQNRVSVVQHSDSKTTGSRQVSLVSDGVGDAGGSANAEAGPARNCASDTVDTPVVAGSWCIPADGGGWSGGGCVDGDGIRAGNGGLARVLYSDREGAGGFVASIVCCCHQNLSINVSITVYQKDDALTLEVVPTSKILPDVLL